MANLFEAVRRGDLDRTRILIESGCNISEKDEHGWTILHLASYKGHLEIVKLLIEAYVAKNADISEKNNAGKSALLVALDWGRLEIVKLLIESGSTVLEKNNSGFTALHHHASLQGHFENCIVFNKRWM